MGGGNSSPASIENNGIHLTGNYSGNSTTTYDNLHTGPDSSTGSGDSTGATVGIKLGAKIPMAGLQNLAYLSADGKKVIVVPREPNGPQLIGATALRTLLNLAYLSADGKKSLQSQKAQMVNTFWEPLEQSDQIYNLYYL